MKHDSIDCLKALLPNFVSEWIGPTAIATAITAAGVPFGAPVLAAAGICAYLGCSIYGTINAKRKEELDRQAIATLRDYVRDGETDHAKLKLTLNTLGCDLLISQDELSKRLASLEAFAKTSIATEEQVMTFFREHDGLLASLSLFIEDHFTEVTAALGRQDLKLDDIKAGNAELLADVRSVKTEIQRITALFEKQLGEANEQLSRKDQQIAESAQREADLIKLVAIRLTIASEAGDARAKEAIANVEAGKPAQGSVEFYDARLPEANDETLQLHHERAVAARAAHDISAAIESYIYITIHEPEDIDAWNELGQLQQLRGLLTEAESSYLAVLALAGDDEDWQATAYGNVSMVLQIRGDLDRAEAMCRKALAIDEKLGHLERIASHLGTLGAILKTRGDFYEAEAVHHESLAIYEKLGSLEGIAMQLGNLGLVLRTRSDLGGAEAMCRKALEIAVELGRLELSASLYSNLGNILLTGGDYDAAEAMHRKALAINEKLGRLEGIAIVYGNVGSLLAVRDDLDGSEAMYRKALAIHEKLGRLEGVASVYQNLGILAEARKDSAEARRFWTLSRDTYGRLGAKHMAEKIQGLLDSLPPE